METKGKARDGKSEQLLIDKSSQPLSKQIYTAHMPMFRSVALLMEFISVDRHSYTYMIVVNLKRILSVYQLFKYHLPRASASVGEPSTL